MYYFRRDKSSFRIILGGHDLTNADEMNSSASVYTALDVRVHKDYDPVTVDSDIALITLDRKVEFTDEVFPICLPKGEENLFVGEHATVAGTIVKLTKGEMETFCTYGILWNKATITLINWSIALQIQYQTHEFLNAMT